MPNFWKIFQASHCNKKLVSCPEKWIHIASKDAYVFPLLVYYHSVSPPLTRNQAHSVLLPTDLGAIVAWVWVRASPKGTADQKCWEMPTFSQRGWQTGQRPRPVCTKTNRHYITTQSQLNLIYHNWTKPSKEKACCSIKQPSKALLKILLLVYWFTGSSKITLLTCFLGKPSSDRIVLLFSCHHNRNSRFQATQWGKCQLTDLLHFLTRSRGPVWGVLKHPPAAYQWRTCTRKRNEHSPLGEVNTQPSKEPVCSAHPATIRTSYKALKWTAPIPQGK